MRRALIALAVTGVLALGGCATAAPVLPSGVTVSVFQNRFDYSLRVLELKVTNGTEETITITRAAFDSTRFAEPAVWDRPQDVPAGSARDLKVQLPDPVCDDTAPADTVLLHFTLADGTTGSATVLPSDEQGRVDTINGEDCLGVSVAEVATISPPDSLQWMPGADQPATLDISVLPTGATGSVTISSAKGTVLLGLVDPSGAPIAELPVELQVDAGAPPAVIPLRLVPNRCDPHAVEEDKRGTFMPLVVKTGDGLSGTIFVAMGDEVRRAIYEFYADYCGLP